MNRPKTHRVYLSIGSNINREIHVSAALDALDQAFSPLLISRVFESESVGFSGENFYNLVVGFDSDYSVAELATIMHTIEQDNERRRDGARFGPRTLDIDILTYGDCTGLIDGVLLPRDEILVNAFVLVPLVDIAAEELHPLYLQSYQTLMTKPDISKQKLWPVSFIWQGRIISSA